MQDNFYKKIEYIEILKEEPSPSLTTLTDYARLFRLLKRRNQLTLQQIREETGASLDQFYSRWYPNLKIMINKGIIEEIPSEDPSQTLYKFIDRLKDQPQD